VPDDGLSQNAMEYQLTEETDVDALGAAVRAGIRNADPPDVGRRDYHPVGLSIRSSEGVIVGGVYGATMWGWLMVDGLWVAEELRGKGLGRRLMLGAEAVAVDRGCHGSSLGTFDFQARAFYERLGYTVFGELADFPRGHTHYSLWKSLGPARSSLTR
jgi:GNAT superfamily N-acetyltransferase